MFYTLLDNFTLLLKIWAQVCSLLLECLCFCLLSVESVRKSMHACTYIYPYMHTSAHVYIYAHMPICMHIHSANTHFINPVFTVMPPILIYLHNVLSCLPPFCVCALSSSVRTWAHNNISTFSPAQSCKLKDFQGCVDHSTTVNKPTRRNPGSLLHFVIFNLSL